jgi:hypothetical protein
VIIFVNVFWGIFFAHVYCMNWKTSKNIIYPEEDDKMIVETSILM